MRSLAARTDRNPAAMWPGNHEAAARSVDRPDMTQRPDDEVRFADDTGHAHRPEGARIVGIRPVVAKHEDGPGRHDDSGCRARIRDGVIALGKSRAVEEHRAAIDPHGIARQADGPLEEDPPAARGIL